MFRPRQAFASARPTRQATRRAERHRGGRYAPSWLGASRLVGVGRFAASWARTFGPRGTRALQSLVRVALAARASGMVGLQPFALLIGANEGERFVRGCEATESHGEH